MSRFAHSLLLERHSLKILLYPDQQLVLLPPYVMSSTDQSQAELASAHLASEAALSHLADQAPGNTDHVAAVHKSWLARVESGTAAVVAKLAVREHLGNNVAMSRGVNPHTVFEAVPLAVRIGMHLLYTGKLQEELLGNKRVDQLLTEQSIKTGVKYDATGPVALKHIEDFIKTYNINLNELLEPNLTAYPTFNSFFARKLKAGARPVDEPLNPDIITSAADSRLTVFENVDSAKRFWIKGAHFTIPHFFDDDTNLVAPFMKGASIAIFRLAPADYHRSHSPLDAKVGATKKIPGTLFTVNPCAINENLDVFTRNKRDVTMLTVERPSGPLECAFVAIGAMLVGSIFHSVEEGATVRRGDELSGYQYGGSTSILLIPGSANVKWDEDLLTNSRNGLETAVQVGNHIGRFV